MKTTLYPLCSFPCKYHTCILQMILNIDYLTKGKKKLEANPKKQTKHASPNKACQANSEPVFAHRSERIPHNLHRTTRPTTPQWPSPDQGLRCCCCQRCWHLPLYPGVWCLGTTTANVQPARQGHPHWQTPAVLRGRKGRPTGFHQGCLLGCLPTHQYPHWRLKKKHTEENGMG